LMNRLFQIDFIYQNHVLIKITYLQKQAQRSLNNKYETMIN